jgi:hypothetical protein
VTSPFFGRDRLVAQLVARLVGVGLVGVVGPSGSGKSSLVRAELLPALADGVLPGSQGWTRVLLRPGEHPMAALTHALAQALARLPAGAPANGSLDTAVGAEADGHPHDHPGGHPDGGGLLLDAARRCARAGGRLLVVVDQFEEVFTACQDPAERARFLTELVATASADATAALWNTTTGTRVGAPLGTHSQVIFPGFFIGAENDAVAFNPNGRLLATADHAALHSDGAALLWDVATHRRVGPPLRPHPGAGINAVTFSPDGATLATGIDDGRVVLWHRTGPPSAWSRGLTLKAGGPASAIGFAPLLGACSQPRPPLARSCCGTFPRPCQPRPTRPCCPTSGR